MNRPWRVVLGVSLAANALLGGWAFVRSDAGRPGNSVSADGAKTQALASKDAPKSTQVAAFAAMRTDADLETFARAMREAGLPPNLFRAAMRARAAEVFSHRRAALRYPEGLPFWKQTGVVGPSLADESGRIDEEERKTLEAFLGGESTVEAMELAADRKWRFGNLAPEKIARLSQIESAYDAMRDELNALRNLPQKELQDRSRELARELRAEVEAVLSTDELIDYKSRVSRGAGIEYLKGLRDMEVTETEYFAIYREQHAIDSLGLRADGPLDPDTYRAARIRRDERAREVLGEERYLQFLKVSDPQYAAILRIASAHGHTPAAAYEALQMRNNAYSMSSAESALPREQSTAIRTERAAQARARLAGLVGPAVADEILKSNPGVTFDHEALKGTSNLQ